MSRRKKKTDDSIHTEWLGTYSDTVTLLLTFFVLLYSFSTVDVKKLQGVSDAFQSMVGGGSGPSIVGFDKYQGDKPISVGKTPEMKNKELIDKLENSIVSSGLSGKVNVIKESKGIVLQFSDNVLFDSGKAELNEGSLPILGKVSEIIKGIPNDIVVEGHTDNVPIRNSEVKSNWELSCFRAVNVLKYFIENKKINPGRLSAVGYGEYKPQAKNDTDANRARNRRVNVMILYNEGDYSSNE